MTNYREYGYDENGLKTYTGVEDAPIMSETKDQKLIREAKSKLANQPIKKAETANKATNIVVAKAIEKVVNAAPKYAVELAPAKTVKEAVVSYLKDEIKACALDRNATEDIKTFIKFQTPVVELISKKQEESDITFTNFANDNKKSSNVEEKKKEVALENIINNFTSRENEKPPQEFEEDLLTTKIVGLVKDGENSKIILGKGRETGNKESVVIDNKVFAINKNTREIKVPKGAKNIEIISTPNYKTSSFSNKAITTKVPILRNKRIVNNNLKENIVDCARPPVSSKISKIDFTNKTFISNSYLSLNKENDLEVFFFVDVEQIITKNSSYKKISENIEDISAFINDFKISDFKITRRRINPISKQDFDAEEPDEIINLQRNTPLIQVGTYHETKVILYKFVDKTLKDKTCGSYRYNIQIYYVDPLTTYLQTVLDRIEDRIEYLNLVENKIKFGVATEFENKYYRDFIVSYYTFCEKLFYGEETSSNIFDSYSYNIFLEKYNKLYIDFYLYYKRIKSNNLLSVSKQFKEYFDSDYINDSKYDMKYLDVLESPIKFLSEVLIANNSNSFLNKTKNLSKNDVLEYFKDFSLTFNGQFSYLDGAIQKEKERYRLEILLFFEDGTNGERWVGIFDKETIQKANMTNDLYLCRLLNENNQPLYNQFFVIVNDYKEIKNTPTYGLSDLSRVIDNKIKNYDFDILKDGKGNTKEIQIKNKTKNYNFDIVRDNDGKIQEVKIKRR